MEESVQRERETYQRERERSKLKWEWVHGVRGPVAVKVRWCVPVEVRWRSWCVLVEVRWRGRWIRCSGCSESEREGESLWVSFEKWEGVKSEWFFSKVGERSGRNELHKMIWAVNFVWEQFWATRFFIRETHFWYSNTFAPYYYR